VSLEQSGVFVAARHHRATPCAHVSQLYYLFLFFFIYFFFSFYIIPLAKKLKDCGVFGVSSGEYLGYALKNRELWESQGQQVVEEMIEHVRNEENQN